jgi:ubiquinone/menaquinone biosynthesis C-methylase UbiE
MIDHICPWWGGFFIDNRIRRWLHDPRTILEPQIRPGMTTLDFGCGMGLFSLAMADLVTDDGTVIAADLQPQMLKTVRKRAEKAGLSHRIRTHVCQRTEIGVRERIDFALAFWSAHEAPDITRLLNELYAILKPASCLLLVEPRGHVTRGMFAQMLDTAHQAGFALISRPSIRLSRSAVLQK